MKSTFGSLHEHGPAVAHLELHLAAAADHLLGRDAVDLLRPRAHELDAAARDDVGLEAVRAQVGEQLEHRLVDHLGVGPIEARVPRGRDPVADDLRRTRRSSCPRASPPPSPAIAFSPPRERALHVAGEERLEGLRGLPLGMLRRQRLHAVEREGELEVDRLLGPERAVVVEDGDALGGRHEAGPASLVTFATKLMMACFGGPSFHDGSGSVWAAADAEPRPSRRWRARRDAWITGSTSLCEADSFRITSSRLKLAGFCRIGNSLKLSSHCAANACAGTMRNIRCDHPLAVVERLGPALERVGAQVVEFGARSLVNSFCQTSMPGVVLLHERDLPLLDADGHQVAVVAPVEELLAAATPSPRP